MDEEDEEEEDEEELSMVLNVKGLFTGSFIKVSFQAKKQSNQTFQLWWFCQFTITDQSLDQ